MKFMWWAETWRQIYVYHKTKETRQLSIFCITKNKLTFRTMEYEHTDYQNEWRCQTNYSRNKDRIFKISQKKAGINLSHHPSSLGFLRVTNTKNGEIFRNYISISGYRLQNSIYSIDFRMYLHLCSKTALPEGRAVSLLPGKPESPNHQDFLLLTSFLLHHPNFHV